MQWICYYCALADGFTSAGKTETNIRVQLQITYLTAGAVCLQLSAFGFTLGGIELSTERDKGVVAICSNFLFSCSTFFVFNTPAIHSIHSPLFDFVG